MLDKYVFNEETNEVEFGIVNSETGEESAVTGPSINEAFMIKVLLEKYSIDSLSKLDDILEKNSKSNLEKNSVNNKKSNH